MAKIINFPSLADREWSIWDEAIRTANRGTLFDKGVLDIALPRIKEHWDVLFKPTTIEAPPKPIPGELTESQAAAIQALLESNAQLLIDYHKSQRAVALGRLVQCELTLAYHRVHGVPA